MTNEELTARYELRQLVERYAQAADDRDAAGFAGVFTEDATFDSGVSVVSGRQALLEVAPKLARYQRTMHFVGNHHVDFTGDDLERATGRVLCIAHHLYENDDGRRDHVMHIRYDDEYVKVAGEWRISSRRLDLLWVEDRAVQ